MLLLLFSCSRIKIFLIFYFFLFFLILFLYCPLFVSSSFQVFKTPTRRRMELCGKRGTAKAQTVPKAEPVGYVTPSRVKHATTRTRQRSRRRLSVWGSSPRFTKVKGLRETENKSQGNRVFKQRVAQGMVQHNTQWQLSGWGTQGVVQKVTANRGTLRRGYKVKAPTGYWGT